MEADPRLPAPARLRRAIITAAFAVAVIAAGVLTVPAPSSAAAATVAVQLSPSTIAADGASTSTATATVTNGPLLGLFDNVAFSSDDSGIHFGPVTKNGDGTYSTILTGSTTPGTAIITATDTAVSPNASGQAVLTQTVRKKGGPSSTTSLVASPRTAVTNQVVTLSASVSSNGLPSSGTVTFTNGGIPIGGCEALAIKPSDPTALCHAVFSAASSPERLQAQFAPGPSYAEAASAGSATLSVLPDATSTAVSVAKPAVTVGAQTTYTATVAGADPGPFEPSGTVTFLDHNQPIPACAHQPVVPGGNASTATCTISYPAPGPHQITAAYSGDRSFGGSASPSAQPVNVSSGVLGTVTAHMQWTFRYSPSYTEIVSLLISVAPRGSIVRVSCHGAGCPYAARSLVVSVAGNCAPKTHRCSTAGPHTIDLAPAFRNHRLAIGDVITVTVAKPQWVGKHYMFRIRPRRGPKIVISCVAPGASAPRARC